MTNQLRIDSTEDFEVDDGMAPLPYALFSDQDRARRYR
jgi:hypothetical protein